MSLLFAYRLDVLPKFSLFELDSKERLVISCEVLPDLRQTYGFIWELRLALVKVELQVLGSDTGLGKPYHCAVLV
jgi:hypothetical protein